VVLALDPPFRQAADDGGVARILLLPVPTSDGRHLVLRAVVLTPRERLRRLLRGLRRR